MENNKILMSDVNTIITNEYDLFICFSSFEERCLSFATAIQKNRIRSSIIINNLKNSETQNNLSKLANILTGDLKIINIDINDPIDFADKFKDELSTHTIRNILIDITTFTHEFLLIAIKLIKNLFANIKITCVYSNAADYSVGQQKEYKWLSRGIKSIRSILGYGGNFSPMKKTHLMVIVGYEFDRAMKIIDAIEPNSLSLAYGKPENTTTEKGVGANEFYMHLIAEIKSSYFNLTQFELPCNNPKKAKEEIIKQIEAVGDQNIIIVPMNNKLTTLGVYLATIDNPQVQVCYAPAIIYNIKEYSSPGKYCYVDEI